MKVLTGISANMRKLGCVPFSICGACNQISNLHIWETYITPRIYHIPTVKIKKNMFATCTLCKKTMQIKKTKANSLRKSINTALLPKDFETII